MGKHRNKQTKGQGRFPEYPRKGFTQSFARFRKETCPGWGDSARSLVDDCVGERVRNKDAAADEPLLRGVKLLLPDLDMYFVKRVANRKKMGNVWLPDLMDLWERMPRVVRFSKAAAELATKVDTSLFDDEVAKKVFPCALFLDFSLFCDSYCDVPEGLFVWPTMNWSKQVLMRAVTFPEAKVGACSPLVDMANGDFSTDYAKSVRASMISGFTAERAKVERFGMRPLVSDGSHGYGTRLAASMEMDDIWKLLEATNNMEERPSARYASDCRGSLSDLVAGRTAIVWEDSEGAMEKVNDILFGMLTVAFGGAGGVDVEQTREGDVDVLLVRTAGEAAALRKQGQLEAKVQTVDAAREDAVRKLAQARAEISALRAQAAALGSFDSSLDCAGDYQAAPDTIGAEDEAIEDVARLAGAELEKARAAWEARLSQLEKQVGVERQKAQDAERRASLAEDKASALESRAQIIDEVQLPLTCESAASLAQRAWPDKLLLLPSAHKSAAAFNPKRADEVFDVLRACALHLHRLAFSDGAVDVTRAFQAASGYEVAMRDVKLVRQSARLKKARTFVYRSHKVEMIPHVKGSSNKPGEALRVHFYLDHERRLVVIGHCGEHLTGEVAPN